MQLPTFTEPANFRHAPVIHPSLVSAAGSRVLCLRLGLVLERQRGGGGSVRVGCWGGGEEGGREMEGSHTRW